MLNWVSFSRHFLLSTGKKLPFSDNFKSITIKIRISTVCILEITENVLPLAECSRWMASGREEDPYLERNIRLKHLSLSLFTIKRMK